MVDGAERDHAYPSMLDRWSIVRESSGIRGACGFAAEPCSLAIHDAKLAVSNLTLSFLGLAAKPTARVIEKM